jgi:hypothetical protein
MKIVAFSTALAATAVSGFAPTAFMPANNVQGASSSSLSMALKEGESELSNNDVRCEEYSVV